MRPETSLRGRLGGRMIPSGGGGGGGASTFVTRPPVTTVIDAMSCFTPSSKISNSSFFRSGMKLPLSSRTMMSLVTRSTVTLKVGFSCAAGVAGFSGAAGGVDGLGGCVCADCVGTNSTTARTTMSPVDQKPFIFRLIASGLYIAKRPSSRSRDEECGGQRRDEPADQNRVIRRVFRRFGFAGQRERLAADFARVGAQQFARNRPEACEREVPHRNRGEAERVVQHVERNHRRQPQEEHDPPAPRGNSAIDGGEARHAAEPLLDEP